MYLASISVFCFFNIGSSDGSWDQSENHKKAQDFGKSQNFYSKQSICFFQSAVRCYECIPCSVSHQTIAVRHPPTSVQFLGFSCGAGTLICETQKALEFVKALLTLKRREFHSLLMGTLFAFTLLLNLLLFRVTHSTEVLELRWGGDTFLFTSYTWGGFGGSLKGATGRCFKCCWNSDAVSHLGVSCCFVILIILHS